MATAVTAAANFMDCAQDKAGTGIKAITGVKQSIYSCWNFVRTQTEMG
jgi:hypothetical protein